jgi:alpha-ketoglutarate-dependent taurine dioxygenase
VLLIRGVPIGDLPATPATPRAAVGKDRRTEMLLLAAARLLGHPVGYLPEHGGDLVQNIVPVQATADRQVSTSSRVQLEFHTEAAFHPHRPRYLLLLCLRGDPSAETTYCSVRDMVPVLDPAQVAILRQARFATGVDESYIGFRSDALGPAMPVLSGPSGQERICFDGDLMVGLDPEAHAAIESLRIATRRVQGGVVLTAGDLLIIDNTVAVHGRTPFTPRFDGTDRWLQRAFVVNDLAASADDRRGRIIATEFTDTYPQ